MLISTGSHISCPFNSADFLNNIDQILAERFSAKTEQDCRDPECEYAPNSMPNFHLLKKSAVSLMPLISKSCFGSMGLQMQTHQN